jgi:hypothetical protein
MIDAELADSVWCIGPSWDALNAMRPSRPPKLGAIRTDMLQAEVMAIVQRMIDDERTGKPVPPWS